MSHEPPTERRAKIRPLQSLKADGTPYTRPDNVLDSIAYYQGVPESVRVADAPRMPSEALAYFIRNTDRSSRALYDRLFLEVTQRAPRVVHESSPRRAI